LFDVCVSATGCDHFGLLIGQRATASSLGLVGQLMLTAPTLKDAILDLCTNQRRYTRGAVVYFVKRDNVAYWGYGIHQPSVLAVEHIGDAGVAAGLCMLKELIGAAPDEILIARRPPRETAPYLRFFGAMPLFDAQQNAFAFPIDLLDRPVRSADPERRRQLK